MTVFTNILTQKSSIYKIKWLIYYVYVEHFPFFVHADGVYFKYVLVIAVESKTLHHVSIYLGKTVAGPKANNKIIDDFSCKNLEQ